jgi:nicotinate-nucleotide pyrophosphorylase (carboxylating)
MPESFTLFDRIIRLALDEDIGSGDVTTSAVIPPAAWGRASLLTRERVVLAGLPIFKRVFALLEPEIRFAGSFEDGEEVEPGMEIGLLEGPLAPILTGERAALNFLQRMCGIATTTREYVRAIGSSKARILDTRKTSPGLRGLDKYAVRVGGGSNHRFGLFDGILIKDNHIAASGSVAKAVELARAHAPHTLKIEVEVENLDGVREALKAGSDIILLDNMPSEEMRQAVQWVQGRALLEASGGITLETLHEVASTGVDFISAGALTHSVRASDLSLEIIPSSTEA